MPVIRLLLFLLGIFAGSLATAQNAIGTGAARKLYEQHCMSCHGENLQGGLGGSLLDRSEWKQVGRTVSFLEYVKEGNLEMGMPAFGEQLSDPQIRSLEILIEETRRIERLKGGSEEEASADGKTYSAGPYRFALETVVDELEMPWSVAFRPQGGMWIAEKTGQLRRFEEGVLHGPVEGLPEIWVHGQGGLMEVALHPDYVENAWVYLGYSASSGKRNGRTVGMTRVVRGRIVDDQWLDEQLIFEAPEATHSASGVHFGTRFVFQGGYLFFAIGDRGAPDQAQDLSLPNGKVHRVYEDGRVPEDNPFVDRKDAFATIWTYGNRNAQGLDAHPVTGEIWASEHGPRGGDEMNLIEKGVNYGWPVITYGMNYNGTPITEKTEAPGMAQPKLHWTPSIAVCGIDFYEGEVFPEWTNDLFVGGLASQELHRLEIRDGEVVEDEVVLRGAGRVRDVASGPDGYLYLVLNGPDRIVRLVPR